MIFARPCPQQGTGYVAEDGGGEPVRVRASFPNDAEIRRTVDCYRVPVAGSAPQLPAVPPRRELPAPAVWPNVVEILRERGFGYVLGLDPPVRRRRRLAWPRAPSRRPMSQHRQAGGWPGSRPH